MKCFYRIILENEKVIPYFVPKSLESTDQDMFYFDYFAYACRDQETFYKQIKKLLGTDEEIKTITIDYKRDKNTKNYNPYSIEFGNPYLKEVFKTENGRYLNIKRSKARVLGTNVYDSNVVVLDKDCDVYREVKDYIFDYLQNDPDKFFKSIFNKKNDYVTIMKQYAEIYKMNEANDQEEILVKERDIADHLAKYKTFRSVVVAIYRYERKQEKKRLKEEKEALETLAKEPKKKKEEKDLVQEFNEEREEFVTKEEYNEMANGEAVRL